MKLPETRLREPSGKAVPGLDTDEKPKAGLPARASRFAVGFPARVAEFLLLFRLRARRRSALCGDMLERAVHILVVTCKSWFCAEAGRAKTRRFDRN